MPIDPIHENVDALAKAISGKWDKAGHVESAVWTAIARWHLEEIERTRLIGEAFGARHITPAQRRGLASQGLLFVREFLAARARP